MMSSSSSDSDSDDCEPIRKIKINIRPKGEVIRPSGADVDEIKASVQSWRPLGPPVHPSLSRRQSSLSSMASLSIGSGSIHGTNQYDSNASGLNNNVVPPKLIDRNSNSINSNYNHGNDRTIRSSPSCSSLVNEFNNRTSFSNFMSNCSRTSSPITLQGQPQQIQSFSNTNLCDPSVPIAIAIQESIELTVKGGKQTRQVKPTDTVFETRGLGNIKIAFPHSFARLGTAIVNSPILKLRLNCTENILQYYASTLIKNINSQNGNSTECPGLLEEGMNIITTDKASDSGKDDRFPSDNLFDFTESPKRPASASVKIIEFDMHALMQQLTQMYKKSPTSRYYNVDVLRYKIAPIERFEQSPLQVCAYWKIEPKLVKLRIDFKHSNQACGVNLERLREISFSVDLSGFVPGQIDSPWIVCEPSHADWNSQTKQLTWKFDNLLAYYKTDGYGSLLAKLDFRQHVTNETLAGSDINSQILDTADKEQQPKPIDVKFLIVDSTLSKVRLSIDSNGYRMSFLKKEVRSGRYKSEPYLF